MRAFFYFKKISKQNWEGGVNTPPPYLVKLLERVVKEDLEAE